MLDIVATSSGGGRVNLLEGNGDGTLKAAVITTTGASNPLVALADLNGDGVIDLAVPNLSGGTSGLIVSLGSISETATLASVSIPGGGAHNVVASYEGDSNADVSSSVAGSFTGTEFTTTLALDIAPVTATPGQAVVLTAGLSPSSGGGYTAAGTVTFADGGVAIGSPVSLSSGQAVLTKSDFALGAHSITATYSGDTNFLTAAATASLTGTKFATTLALGIAPATATPGQTVTLTATLSPASGAGHTAAGTVTFADGGVALGSPVTLGSGQAALTKSNFALGSHSITATYSGDTNFLTTAATAVAQVKVAPDYSIAANPTTITIARGQTGAATLTATPVGGYHGQVAFTCTGLPQYATCSFTPASLTLSGDDTAQTVQFKLITAVSATKGAPPIPGSNHEPTLALLSPFGILALVSVARRRRHARPWPPAGGCKCWCWWPRLWKLPAAVRAPGRARQTRSLWVPRP